MKNNKLKFELFFFAIIFFVSFGYAKNSEAATTSGGVNWQDSLQYTKPAFYPIIVPDTCVNTYYINLDAGSNGSGTSGSPFNSFGSLAGKAGMSGSGGPSCVYLRGTGTFQRYNSSGVGNFWGASESEIYIRNWPGYTATLEYNYVTATSGVHFQYIIWDGGPDMGITFLAGDTNYAGAWNFKYEGTDDNLSNWKFYRTKWQCGSNVGELISVLGRSLHMSFINNEFSDCLDFGSGLGHQFYISGATNSGSWPNDCTTNCAAIDYQIRNNIFRDIDTSVEVNMRNSTAPFQIDGLVIDGNAFHNMGKGLCGTDWACRPAIILSDTSLGSPNWRGVMIKNNLIWNTGSGAIWTRSGDAEIYNNSITAWGLGSGSAFNQAIGGAGYPSPATVKNNAIYDGAKDPFDSSSFVASNNLCASGKSCGTSKQNYSTNTFLSTDENNANFLKIGSSSEALDHGTDVSINNSYFGISRTNTPDIGADEYSAGGGDAVAPNAPSGLSVN
jgi:hypothetical protein